MNIERLNKLADLLENDAANPEGVKFDLGVWAKDANDSDIFDKRLEPDQVLPVNCNTAACAIGLAAISGVFKDEGLGYVIDSGLLIPQYREHDGMYAASWFFDISYQTASYLFDTPTYAITRGAAAELAVAKRIRDTVAGTSFIPGGTSELSQ